MMIALLLAAVAPDAAQPACTIRRVHVPAGKLSHAAQAVTCAGEPRARVAPVRESRVVTPRKKV